MSSEQDQELRTLLKEEYFKLQDQYEGFDNRALLIKSWVASGSVAALALAFHASKPVAFYIPVFVAIITACVWMLETTWKMFQSAFGGRIRTIEAYFRDDPDRIEKTPQPLQIYHAWYRNLHFDPPVYESERSRGIVLRYSSQALHPSVFIPYLPILAVCVFIFFLLRGA